MRWDQAIATLAPRCTLETVRRMVSRSSETLHLACVASWLMYRDGTDIGKRCNDDYTVEGSTTSTRDRYNGTVPWR